MNTCRGRIRLPSGICTALRCTQQPHLVNSFPACSSQFTPASRQGGQQVAPSGDFLLSPYQNHGPQLGGAGHSWLPYFLSCRILSGHTSPGKLPCSVEVQFRFHLAPSFSPSVSPLVALSSDSELGSSFLSHWVFSLGYCYRWKVCVSSNSQSI